MSASCRDFALALLTCAAALRAQTILSGRVVDENGAPLDSARVRAELEAAGVAETLTNPAGAFRLSLPPGVPYRLLVERTGYYRLEVPALSADGEVTLVLNPQREVFQSVEVGESPSHVDPAQTSREDRLTGTQINSVPYPGTHSLRNAIKLTPGAVQDPSGGIHLHGAAENQTRYLLNGYDITDPVTGRYATLLAVEGVREMSIASARRSPEFGRGSGGTIAIRTDSGTDRLRYTATNFIPGVDTNRGIRLGRWTPRASVSGPLRRGRAWYAQNLYGDYNSTLHPSLPRGQDSNRYWALGDLIHAQVNLTRRNILYADLLGNLERENRAGLSALDPVETTLRRRSYEWMAAVKDTHSWGGASLIEAGFSALRVDHRRTPQGAEPYVFSALGRRGNYFADSRESGSREQFFVNYYPPAFRAAGRHQLQLGADLQRLSYAAAFRRNPYRTLSPAGLLTSETLFLGAGRFRESNVLSSSYLQDQWRPTQGLTLALGLRQDWDRFVGQSVLSPRLALAWTPFRDARTKIAGGYGVLFDASHLAILTRPLDQASVTVPYSPEGLPALPSARVFLAGQNLALPRFGNWSASLERDFGRRLSLRIEWYRKRGRDGFVYAVEPDTALEPLPSVPGGVAVQSFLRLANLRRDFYHELALTLRQSFGEHEWFASYGFSRAVSNAVLDIRVDQVYQAGDNTGRMPWDAPHRFLSWGYLPLPVQRGKWALAYLVDARSGFPFGVVRDTGEFVGPPDSHRFPLNFSLNLHLERRFEFRRRRFALRVGVNNLTGRQNPSSVFNVIGSPRFLQFTGDEGRHVVVRLRFFARGAM